MGYGPDVRIPTQIQEMPVAGIGLLAFANGRPTGAAIPHRVASIGSSDVVWRMFRAAYKANSTQARVYTLGSLTWARQPR